MEEGFVSFNFPIPFTEDEFLASMDIEADDFYEYEGTSYTTHTYSYKKASEIYIGSCYFEYTFKDGELYEISMDYTP